MRPKDQIKKEIENLKRQKEQLPEKSIFGDPNWKIIDAQIFILTNPNTFTEDEAWNRYEHLGNESMSQILDAFAFIEGEIDSLTEDI